MDTNVSLTLAMEKLIKDIASGPILDGEGQISTLKLSRPRIRLHARLETPPIVSLPENSGDMAPLTEEEIQHCATVIVAAFFNPKSVNWDYERFAESAKKRESGKYFINANLGVISKPAVIIDEHGRILMWYLPGLLLLPRVNQLNLVTVKYLKKPLCKSANDGTGWRSQNFTVDPAEATFGAGRLSMNIGGLARGRQRLEDPICSSPMLDSPAVQKWLQAIDPVQRLLNAVLNVVHPEMYDANSKAIPSLLGEMTRSIPSWPSVYHAMDIIANRISPSHTDQGSATTFYDHLVSLGQDHDARLFLDTLQGEFQYKSGTSVLFPGKVFRHSVPEWCGGERVVIAHYSKDGVHDRVNVARPLLPTQLGWWSKYQPPQV